LCAVFDLAGRIGHPERKRSFDVNHLLHKHALNFFHSSWLNLFSQSTSSRFSLFMFYVRLIVLVQFAAFAPRFAHWACHPALSMHQANFTIFLTPRKRRSSHAGEMYAREF
jgi:hypothetical protein